MNRKEKKKARLEDIFAKEDGDKGEESKDR